MTRGAQTRPARRVLWGALKWVPILLIPFSAFFFETWLQLQIFKRDYEAAELRREIREINQRIDGLEERADELMTLKRITEQAPDLGLVEPEPNQVEVVKVTPGPEVPTDDMFYEMARLPAPERNDSKAEHDVGKP